LRLLEDPALDARDAHPAWFPDHDAVVQLYPDADPPPDADAFEFWRVPGRKQLIHDGKRLVLMRAGRPLLPAAGSRPAWKTAWPTSMPPAPALPCARYARSRPNWTHWPPPPWPRCGGPRPTPAAVLELHTLQALDATLAGASLREVAEGLFGADAVAADWHKATAACVLACAAWCDVAMR
jgi:hypothetical protein